jgi:D-alanyl-D-alanine carboxypeptidase/D-alanyl-D-alanine-endopeptidase (penicillin-binding protein 4)
MRFNRNKQFSVLVALCAAFLIAGLAQADLQTKINARLAKANLGRTSVAIMVMDLQSNRVLAQRGADLPMIPASNMKLYTTAVALSQLGPDFVFSTGMRLAPATNGAGWDLIVRGDGDPAFADPKILAKTPSSALNGTPYQGKTLDVELLVQIWVDQVRKTGVKRINRLVIDDRVFDQNRLHPSWPKDQLHKWYCAQVSGLNFHTNCIEIYAQPTANGQRPQVWLKPQASFLTVTNRATSGANNSFWAARRLGTNELIVSGQVKHRLIKPIDVTLDDPAIFFGRVLAQRLARSGIAVGSLARAAGKEKLPAGKSLHVIRTPISEVIRRCNKESQNLYAESLIKRVGHKFTGQPGSWSNGAAALERFLHHKLGASIAEQVRLSDGSGMSRQNRITARATVELLRAMHRDPKLGQIYRQSLSVGGVDGTLSKYFKTGLNGTVHAKTGYISQVRTLSGYLVVPNRVVDRSGKSVNIRPKVVAFSILFNDIKAPVSGYKVKQLRDDLVRLIDADVR